MRAVWVLALVGCGRLSFDATGADDTQPIDAANDGIADSVDAPPPPMNVVGAFTPRGATSPPSARRATGAAVAPDNRIWVFGGFAGMMGVQNTLAAYAPTANTWISPAASGAPPPARERHVLAFDTTNNALVVFGGYSGTFPSFVHHDELYVYSVATNAWMQIPKAGAWPTPRKDSSMVWVPSQNKMLFYGGNNGSGAGNRFSDLWTLSISGTTATWTLLSPGGVTPPKQSAACVDYDPAARRLLLYGGEMSDGSSATTTYQYLVDSNAWQLDTITGTTPGARAFAQCAWDPSVGRLAVYGGQDNGGNPIGGTFAYEPNAKRWETVPASTVVPGNCGDGGAAYSAALGGMFWFGGRTAAISYSNESWVLDLQPQ